MPGETRPASFYWLAIVFALFVLFLYGPMITIFILSFQGPQGGLTFPMEGISTFWFSKLFEGVGVVDIWAAFRRSARLGAMVMTLTVILSVLAGLAFRKRFRGEHALFYATIASLIVPSIIVSLGIGLQFRILDNAVKSFAAARGWAWLTDGYTTAMGLFTSALGAHLTWTLPFGLLIMFAVFNRFDKSYEEAALNLGATPWQTFRYVVLPIIGPSVVGVGMFGFTLSWDEIARSSQAIGDLNTLPLELQGLTTTVTTPEIYALGTLTTAVSFLVIAVCVACVFLVSSRRRRLGSGIEEQAIALQPGGFRSLEMSETSA
jgi:putative spermidine/putrescine transport system permease protein